MIEIRAYNPAADYQDLRACFVELQAWERQFEPSMPAPQEAADPYLADMLARYVASGGQVFVAEAEGAVIGFVCVFAMVTPDLDEAPEPYSYISDLVVRAAYRGQGIGRRLIAASEDFARSAGARRLKVGVLVRNDAVHDLYRDCGFRDYTVQLIKEL
jgi:GNAT superfamily N-acetyltransferase